ncbi:hypothetical protein SAMN05216268_101256 [Streptomyces yunnanensis]|uniref:DUF7848 domain-containing protein n=1 Tax=Streptomyces yunnanensis TaxID=156453 RepID=A0A9X8QML1_9ACTN|nr:hypothetical protein SAMN05216268_101256 [Streptomyces yunnanensis]
MDVVSVWRIADWDLDVGTSDSGSIYKHQCMSCGQKSSAAVTADGPDEWCLRHAERTGHTEFRGTVTTFFRASLAEGPR